MPASLHEFYVELLQEIYGFADADGKFAEDAFFDVLTGTIIDAGDLEAADRAHYVSPRGIRVDGYGGDPAESNRGERGASSGVLTLLTADFCQEPEIATLTATEMDACFRRLSNFLQSSLDGRFRDRMEESTVAHGLADLIEQRWPIVSRVRLLLISNRVLSSRVDGREAGDLLGVPLTYTVWDLNRLHRYISSGHEREDIVIDLDEFGGPISALPAHIPEHEYESYLAVVPGEQLARIYDRWGSRLLEQNLRVFLQARAKVNRGIRNTLNNDPAMFFAYNNGITATAESIETADSPHGVLLTSLRNLQIVNGGQTTASIHAALYNKEVELNRVFVQMKLSIVDSALALQIVPKISEFANTQNRVSASDFFSNHPFHVRIEGFSRRIYAPSRDGSFRQAKWFYERARGQYQEARSGLTMADRRRFDIEYPRSQVFTKTDLAKFVNVWRLKPDVVSKGAQKNFADFAAFVGREWNRTADSFNEMYYREVVAKAIIFRSVEKLVTNEKWYEGGYRANVVAYTISKLAHDLDVRSDGLDFAQIWSSQEMRFELHEALRVGAKAVHDVIVDSPERFRNVTEWAKQQACWHRVMRLKIGWSEHLGQCLQSSEALANARRAAAKDQRVLNGIEAQVTVVEAGSKLWSDAKAWGTSRNLLSPDDIGVLSVAESMPGKIPTERQSERAINVLRRLHSEGCLVGIDLV